MTEQYNQRDINYLVEGEGGPAFSVGPAGSGARFRTINDALSAGNEAFPDDPFSIITYPDTYEEDVTITRDGVSLFAFANQNFTTVIDGDLNFIPSTDNDILTVTNFNVFGQINFTGATRGQLWGDNVSAQSSGANPAWNVTNTGTNSRVLVRNARGVNTGTGPGALISMSATGEARFYGGNALFRNSTNQDNIAFDVAGGAGGFCFLLGPGLQVDGQTRVTGGMATIITDAQLRTAGAVSPLLMDGTAMAAGLPLNAVNNVLLTTLGAGGPPPAAIETTIGAAAMISYFSAFNLTGAPGFAGGPTSMNLAAVVIP